MPNAKILIVYHSQQKGNTEAMANLVAKGIEEIGGIAYEMINVYKNKVPIEAVEACAGIAIGSPDYFTYVAGGVKQFFDDLKIAEWEGKQVTGKNFVGFITHGGGGGAFESLERLANSFKFVKLDNILVCKGKPEGAFVDKAIELGRLLAQAVKGNK